VLRYKQKDAGILELSYEFISKMGSQVGAALLNKFHIPGAQPMGMAPPMN